MENQEIIDKHYNEAVKGLNEIILEDKDLWYSYVINLPDKLQVTYTIIVFHQQVFNGGLHQYFFNAYGQFGYLTVDNLKLIKADKTAEILNKALKAINIDTYDVNEFREKIFNKEIKSITEFEEKLSSFLDELDEKYYSLDEDLEQLLVNYLSN